MAPKVAANAAKAVTMNQVRGMIHREHTRAAGQLTLLHQHCNRMAEKLDDLQQHVALDIARRNRDAAHDVDQNHNAKPGSSNDDRNHNAMQGSSNNDQNHNARQDNKRSINDIKINDDDVIIIIKRGRK